MQEEAITIAADAGFDTALEHARRIALQGNPDPMLLAWADRRQGRQSPAGVQCEIRGRPGWEVYGESHGGRLRISVNDDLFVFIFN